MPCRPLPSDAPDSELADAVDAAIKAIWTNAGLTSEEFWDCFSGGKWALPAWKRTGGSGFALRLVNLFDRGKASSGFKGQDEHWQKLEPQLASGAHLRARLAAYAGRYDEWKGIQGAHNAAKLNEAHARRSSIVVDQSGSAPGGPVAESQWMSLADFAAPSDDALKNVAWRFLCGDPPTPVTAVHAAVRREEIGSVLEQCQEPSRIVILHGPMGEGTSTAVLQAAHQAVSTGRAVLRIRDQVQVEGASASVATATAPLFIIEDDHDLSHAPGWTSGLMDCGGTLLIGTQTRRLERVKALFNPKNVRTMPLGRIETSTADAFIDNINRFAPNSDARRRERFVDGLGLSHGRGGLWPAQYQATRGEALDHRVAALVDAFQPDLQPMLSTLVFMGWVHDQYPNIPPPSWSNVLALYSELDLRVELLVSSVDRLALVVRALDGEFFARRPWATLTSENDPPLALRHRAVTDSLFRWLFGAHRSDHGSFRFDKWDYFIRAVSGSAEADTSAVAFGLCRLMERSHRYDFEHGGELKHRLSGGHASKPGDFLLIAIDHAYDAASPAQRRQLDLMRARLWAWCQWGRKTERAEQARALERATAVVASAWVDRDVNALCGAAVIFDALKAKYAGDRAYAALELLEVAESWEAAPRAGPSMTARTRMSLLTRTDPYPTAELHEASRKAQLLTWPGWDEERLEVLQRLVKSARRSRVEMGAPTDDFGSSRRSLYAAFLHELVLADSRLSTRGVLSLSRPGDYLFGLVRSVIGDWVDDEDAAFDDYEWPQGLLVELQRVASHQRANLNSEILGVADRQLGGSAASEV